jgi:hypothetical protein
MPDKQKQKQKQKQNQKSTFKGFVFETLGKP